MARGQTTTIGNGNSCDRVHTTSASLIRKLLAVCNPHHIRTLIRGSVDRETRIRDTAGTNDGEAKRTGQSRPLTVLSAPHAVYAHLLSFFIPKTRFQNGAAPLTPAHLASPELAPPVLCTSTSRFSSQSTDEGVHLDDSESDSEAEVSRTAGKGSNIVDEQGSSSLVFDSFRAAGTYAAAWGCMWRNLTAVFELGIAGAESDKRTSRRGLLLMTRLAGSSAPVSPTLQRAREVVALSLYITVVIEVEKYRTYPLSISLAKWSRVSEARVVNPSAGDREITQGISKPIRTMLTFSRPKNGTQKRLIKPNLDAEF
ncbi:hypothetical protein GALMADRAFT_209002 [Galerina marginata CBS 339.88]|uniref:Uncharacterized protein n=1 Tax=Galerina marginata (strain CBS 339.88) TaxID=685588 RepID=A0A067THS3_GALM3|nr:hypothetical protein GALMADRAFT_209002 [Galerina marginata CBS 339.88]